MVTRSEPGYAWDFCGGQLAVDFTNTVGSRGGAAEEHLNLYGDLLSWSETRGVTARSVAQRLQREAARRPAVARDALADALTLREALYRVMSAAASGRTPQAADLATVNAHVEASFSGAHLQRAGDRFELAFAPSDRSRLTAPILEPIIRAAVDLLTSDAIGRVRLCSDASCAWLFLDTTRNGTRRWCDMKDCGNRNKVRRFREARH
jgi:predicted RNA-binding Zn ribbon-like protein